MGRIAGRIVLAALERNALFFTAALPSQIFPPLFNRYEGGMSFGNHVDNAVRRIASSGAHVAAQPFMFFPLIPCDAFLAIPLRHPPLARSLRVDT